jgi:quercetin dioxygenase-like cupin family protein
MAMKLERIAWSEGAAPDEAALTRRLERDGFDVLAWADAPGTTYTPHAHGHDESLWCVRGLIVFEIGGAEYPLAAGDRLMLPRDTVHAARVGAQGARYLIGQRDRR